MGKAVVILGCDGQVGRALQKVYPKAIALNRQQLDIADQAQVESYDWSGVGAVINASVQSLKDLNFRKD